MKKLLTWVKSNLMIVICSAVAVLGIAGLFLGTAAAKRIVDKSKKRKTQLAQITKLTKTQIKLPTSETDTSAKKMSRAITEEDVRLLSELFGQMEEEYKEIFDAAVAHNHFGVSEHPRYDGQGKGHFAMLENLFPKPVSAATRIVAKQRYRAAFKDMLGPYSSESAYPNLNSGMPPTPRQIQEKLDAVQNEFLADRDTSSTGKLSVEDRGLIQDRLRDHAMKILKESLLKLILMTYAG